MSFEDLYQDIILEHYRNPFNKIACPSCALTVHHNNPLCGDEITLFLDIKGEIISKATFEGHGCAISQASASMMTEIIQRIKRDHALKLISQMKAMMHGHPPATDLGDLAALEGVAKFPVRIKCALLPWIALQDALAKSKINKPEVPGIMTEESP